MKKYDSIPNFLRDYYHGKGDKIDSLNLDVLRPKEIEDRERRPEKKNMQRKPNNKKRRAKGVKKVLYTPNK